MEPNVSISGTSKPALIAARSSDVQVSLVAVTALGAIRNRPAAAPPRAGRASTQPYRTGACSSSSRRTISASGTVTGTVRMWNGSMQPAVMCCAKAVACTGEAAPTKAIGAHPAAGHPRR